MSTPARLEERIDISAIVSDANSLGSSVISVVQTALNSAEAASASSLARSISSVVASAASGPEASSILVSLESELATSRLSSLLPSGATATEWSEASVTGSAGRTLSTTASTPVNTAARTSPDPSVETANGSIGSETNHHISNTTKIALGVSIPLGIILIALLIFAAYLWGKRTASRQHSKEKNELASGDDNNNNNNSGEALGHHDDAGERPEEADDESRILPPESAAAPGQKQLEAGVRMTIRHVRHELPSPDSTMTSASAQWNQQQQQRRQQQQQDDYIAEMPTEFNITELPSPVGEVEEFHRYPAGLPAYEPHGRFR